MYRLIFSVLIFVAGLNCFSQNHEITISMNTRNDTVLLTHVFASDERLRLDTAIVLIDGKGVFAGNRVLPKGLYWIVNNNSKLFQILITDNQHFGIEADTTDFVHGVRFKSSRDNDIFYEFIRDDIQRQAKQHQLREQFQNAADDAERMLIHEQFQTIGFERNAFIQRLVSQNEKLYVSKFLRALLPLEIPEPPRDADGQVIDPDYVYRWYRANYFSNFDIFDPDMLRTPMYERQLKEYLTWFARNHPPDTVCVELDRMLHKVVDHRELFRYMLASIYNHFVSDENLAARDNYFVHLVDNWYSLHADWATNIEDMQSEADKVRHSLVGRIAPPLDQLLILETQHFRAAALDTAIKNDVHAGYIVADFRTYIESKYLILIFWDVNCGGCRETMQSLWALYNATHDKGLKVLTLQTLQTIPGKGRWIDFINDNDMFGSGWYNGWVIYDQRWRDLYNTSVVPIMYVLNDKREIIFKGRNLDLNWLQSFIEATADDI